MIICNVCGQMIAAHRDAKSEVEHQVGTYIRHLCGAHKINVFAARKIANNAPLYSINLDSIRSHEERWMKARLLWAEGKSVSEIARVYGLSSKAMRTRIQRWRKIYGWFPARAA